MATVDQVIQYAAAVTEAARDGAAWWTAHQQGAARSDGRNSAQAQVFRRLARRAERLRIAAARPLCVAVFGASQAGKSYLVSSLATSGGLPLVAQYGAHALNFLRDMNPQGDKEATGLVTRFTTKPPVAPPQFPIPVRLLSQTDIAKIFVNAYAEDFKLDEPKPIDQVALAALFTRLEALAGPVPVAGMTTDDIEEMREYCEQSFRNNALLSELGTAYWTRAAELVPRLPARLRAEALSPLWGGAEALTRVAATLIGALEQIGFPDIAFCDIEALQPREQGILNADTVFAVATGGRGLVRVQGTNGTVAALDKAHLAALVAELTFPLPTTPWDFFDSTDLLDFPGARSRELVPRLDLLDDPTLLGRVFLRGKVAYLFQRYNAEQEIAAMLLCVGPSNNEVQTLPEMVDGWIRQTIGATPAERRTQRNSLFFVLTKFDSEFVEKEGEDVASGQRWTTRLQASLLDFFGKFHDWPTQWDDKPFNNISWLRSTAVGFDKVFDYTAEPKQEVLAPRAAAFLASRRAAFLANPSVRVHFSEPEAAWDAGLSANDGGIALLASRLRPVCDPALKAEQIKGRLLALARDIDGQLRPLFHDGDMAAELERARARSKAVVRDLVTCARSQRFGALLRALQVTADQVGSIYWRLQSEPEDEAGPVGTASGADDYGELGGLLDDDTPAPAARDRFERLSDLALEDWTRGMQTVAESLGVEAEFRLSRENALMLVGEVARASRRVRLDRKLTQALHAQASFQQRGAAAAQKPTIVVEQTINEFVHTLGFGDVPPAQRPSLPNGRVIFAPRPPIDGLPPIGDKPTPYDSRFHVDWMAALARTIEDNVQDAASGPIDIEQNSRLGRILDRLGTPA